MADTSMTIDYLGGKRYVGHDEAGDQIIIDGEDVALGVRPMEALLAALGTCTAFDLSRSSPSGGHPWRATA